MSLKFQVSRHKIIFLKKQIFTIPKLIGDYKEIHHQNHREKGFK
jgi:hypothetical protein